MKIFCCSCDGDIEARLTDGGEIYPHRRDLKELPFWKCDKCKNFVGCHHKSKDRTKPLGVIPTNAVRQLRKRIHAVLDPIWQSGVVARSEIYMQLTEVLGRQYHTADLRSEDECRLIENFLKEKYSG